MKKYSVEMYEPLRDSPTVEIAEATPQEVAAMLKTYVDRNDYRLIVTRLHDAKPKGVPMQ